MINKLSFMGLVGLLGLLSIPTGDVRYCAFFAFFVFFGYLFTIEDELDELFTAYVRKAASTAFFLQTALFFIIYAGTVLIGDAAVFKAAFPLTFAAGMFVFICLLVIHEYREQRGVESGT